MDTCKTLVGSSVNIIESVESKDLKRVLYELCWTGVNGQLKVDQVTTTLADVAVSRIIDYFTKLLSLILQSSPLVKKKHSKSFCDNFANVDWYSNYCLTLRIKLLFAF